MNKRQKKKLYKKIAGQNPPAWMSYKEWLYHVVIGKPWGGRKKSMKPDNVSEFTKRMTERRIKKNRGGCYVQRGLRKAFS